MAFESPDIDLADLLKDVATGKIRLPDFQREWKWDTDRIAGLLNSISLGYPVGVVMQLEVGGDAKFADRAIAGAEGVVHLPAERLLLDGQQRLTSLYQALARMSPVDTADARGKSLKRWYYIDMAACLDPGRDRDEAIVAVPADRVERDDFGRNIVRDLSSTENECKAELFPATRIFDLAATTQWMLAYLQVDSSDSEARLQRWNRFHLEVLSRFTGYKLPVIVLTKSTPREAVCTVFEKVNTGGVPLNVFELLTATFASEGFKLNDDWKTRAARLHKAPMLRSFEATDFLQIISLLATNHQRTMSQSGTPDAPAVSCKRKDILRLSLTDYQKWAQPAEDALLWARAFLTTECVFTAPDVPYRTQLVPLAAIRAIVGSKADHHPNMDKLRQWYWCGVLGELYGGATETRFARDVEQVPAWLEGGTTPGTVDGANFHANRLLTLRTRNSAAYKGVYALLMRNGCIDWAMAQNLQFKHQYEYAVDIHHIFPQAWCIQQKVDPAKRESIVNKTALSAETNRTIGGRAPGVYLKTIENKYQIAPGKLDELLASHHVDAQSLRSSDFESFFANRFEAILSLVEAAMGKPANREGQAADADDGDATAFDDELEDPDI